MMSDKNVDGEIDLFELIILMWKNKWKIFLFFLFSLIVTYVYSLTYDKDKKLYQTKIYINLISETDFLPYDEYNKFVETYIKREFLDMRYQSQLDSEMIITTAVENYFNKSDFDLIKRKELENLFLKYSTDNLIYKDALRELDFINKNIRLNFPVKKAYYNDVHPFIEINSENTDKESLTKILDYVEKRSNEEVRNYLFNRFKKSITYEIRNAKFKIEDIDNMIEYLENDKISEVLKKKKELLNTNKNIERLKEIFSNLPIVQSENFYVGKFKIDETKIEHMNRFPLKKNLALFGLIGLFFGIIYVFFINFVLRK